MTAEISVNTTPDRSATANKPKTKTEIEPSSLLSRLNICFKPKAKLFPGQLRYLRAYRLGFAT